jgi:hypothetical protein
LSEKGVAQTHWHGEEIERNVIAYYRDFRAELVVGKIIEIL